MNSAAEVLRRERCQAVHAAIKAGRTALPSIGTMFSARPGTVLELRQCPHCQTTVSTPVVKKW